MEALSLATWVFSYAFGFLVLKMRKMDLMSNYSVFFAFSLLYTLVPLLVLHGIHPGNVWTLSLSDESNLVYTHLLVTSLANVSYALGILLFYPRYDDAKSDGGGTTAASGNSLSSFEWMISIFYFAVSIAIFVWGVEYRWGLEERGQIVNSLLGQGKVILSGIYIYMLAYYGFKPVTVLMYLSILVITLFEGSRTTLIAMTLGTIILAREENKISLWKTGLIFTGFLCLVVFMAFHRIGMEVNLSNVFDLLYPVYIEGEYGAYMNLQAYHLLDMGHYDFTYFVNYIVDPVLYLLPRPILELLSINKDGMTVFGRWILNANPMLADKFSPYGGFFYVAEASVAMPYIGPAVIAFLFAVFYCWIAKRKITPGGKLDYMIFTIGFNMVFIKNQISGSSHFFITTLLSVYLIVYFKKLLNVVSAQRA
jgi:hypothetical protein